MVCVKTSEHNVTSARANLTRLIRDAHNDDTITFLTSNGFLVAALVPLAALDGPAEQGYDCPRCELTYPGVKQLLAHLSSEHEQTRS